MSFFKQPLRLEHLRPIENKKPLYARIFFGWMTERPYTYCGIVNGYTIIPGKKGLISVFIAHTDWIIETRNVVNVRNESDERTSRPIRRSMRSGRSFDISGPYRKEDNGTLIIFNNQDRIELAACGEPEVFVKRMHSEYERL